MDGGVNIVDVEDVAKGHILAATKGKVGERYLLGNTNLTIKDYLTLIAQTANAPVPKIKLPYHLALMGGHLLESLAYVTKLPPTLTASEVRIAKMTEWYDCSKAVNKLGFEQTPIEETLHKAVTWFRMKGWIGSRAKSKRLWNKKPEQT